MLNDALRLITDSKQFRRKLSQRFFGPGPCDEDAISLLEDQYLPVITAKLALKLR